jgi:hypothetical protein
MPGCRMRGFVVGGRPPFGDVGDHVSVALDVHPYLLCDCGVPIWYGLTGMGATVFVCGNCQRIADVRRVA